jgi:putative colanic acid biosynthesis UDP-glucose lipid carrier transferase
MMVVFVAGFLSLKIRKVLNLPIDLPQDLSGYFAIISAGALIYGFVSTSGGEVWRGRRYMATIFAKVTGQWLLVPPVILLWLFLFKTSHDFSRVWFLLWVISTPVFLCLMRFCLYLFLRSIHGRGLSQKKVAIIGSGVLSDQLERSLKETSWTGYRVSVHLPMPTEEAIKAIAANDLDEVWLVLPLDQERVLESTLHALRHSASSIRYVPDLFTLNLLNHGMTDILGFSMFDLSATPMTGINQAVKWLEDRVIALSILILVSPLMLLLALGVKLSSSGPVLYRQVRIGLNNKPFEILKFRSMPVDTEKHGVEWGQSSHKVRSRFGQFIRKTSLDELPQFINVLKGDMSVVGPRPERPMFVDQFKDEIPNYMKKHLVKAGITGWAQIHGWRGDTDLNRRIQHDLYYIEHWSLWLDLKIIVLTVFKGFVNKNAG